MSHEKIKAFFHSAVDSVVSGISVFAKNEMLDFFGLDAGKPSDLALNRQRTRLLPQALKAVLDKFNASVDACHLIYIFFGR